MRFIVSLERMYEFITMYGHHINYLHTLHINYLHILLEYTKESVPNTSYLKNLHRIKIVRKTI